MFDKFRPKRIVRKRSELEVSMDRMLKACWSELNPDDPDSEAKGYMAVFCFCVLNAFENMKTFGSNRPEVAKALMGDGSEQIAIELALLGIGRASLDEELEDHFADIVNVSHTVLKTINISPYSNMDYEKFVNGFMPYVSLNPEHALEKAATHISENLSSLPSPMSGILASGLAMGAMSETAKYATSVLHKVLDKLDLE
ncbi:MAG: hypothetical protein ACRBBK_14525 [Paracoccaceae bacterium]